MSFGIVRKNIEMREHDVICYVVIVTWLGNVSLNPTEALNVIQRNVVS